MKKILIIILLIAVSYVFIYIYSFNEPYIIVDYVKCYEGMTAESLKKSLGPPSEIKIIPIMKKHEKNVYIWRYHGLKEDYIFTIDNHGNVTKIRINSKWKSNLNPPTVFSM